MKTLIKIIFVTLMCSSVFASDHKKTIIINDNSNPTLVDILGEKYGKNTVTITKTEWTTKDVLDSLNKYDHESNKYVFILGNTAELENGDYDLRISPNPFYGKTYLKFTINDPRLIGETFDFKLFNSQSEAIKSFSYTVREIGENGIYIGNLSTLSSGRYTVKMYDINNKEIDVFKGSTDY